MGDEIKDAKMIKTIIQRTKEEFNKQQQQKTLKFFGNEMKQN